MARAGVGEGGGKGLLCGLSSVPANSLDKRMRTPADYLASQPSTWPNACSP